MKRYGDDMKVERLAIHYTNFLFGFTHISHCIQKTHICSCFFSLPVTGRRLPLLTVQLKTLLWVQVPLQCKTMYGARSPMVQGPLWCKSPYSARLHMVQVPIGERTPSVQDHLGPRTLRCKNPIIWVLTP